MPQAPTLSDAYGPLAQRNNIADAKNNAMRLGLLMLGLGAGTRGLQGLINLSRRNLRPPQEPLGRVREVSIPVLRQEEEERPFKAANVLTDYVTEPISRAWQGQGSDAASWPLAWPLAAAAGTGGLVGGYKLTDWLLDKRRRAQLEEELEQARSQYEEALTGKSALARDLDALYDRYKQASGDVATDAWGKLMGGALTMGVPLALASGLIAYDLTRKRTPTEVLRKAKQKRLRQLSQKQPPAIYARPQYVDGGAGAPTEDELAGEPLDREP